MRLIMICKDTGKLRKMKTLRQVNMALKLIRSDYVLF